MPWQNTIYATVLTANAFVTPVLDCVALKENIFELHSPQSSYEQQIRMPEHLKIETLRELSVMTKEMTEAYLEVKETRDRTQEMIERTKLPSYSFSDRPPQEVDSQVKHFENSRTKVHEATRPEYNIKTEKTPMAVKHKKNNVLEPERTITDIERVNQVKALDDETRRQERQSKREQERAERRSRTNVLERGR